MRIQEPSKEELDTVGKLSTKPAAAKEQKSDFLPDEPAEDDTIAATRKGDMASCQLPWSPASFCTALERSSTCCIIAAYMYDVYEGKGYPNHCDLFYCRGCSVHILHGFQASMARVEMGG